MDPIDKFEAIKLLLSLLKDDLTFYEVGHSKPGGYADTMKLSLWTANGPTVIKLQVIEAYEESRAARVT